jgi:4a-hydroxytetrahydrobiopterin dehydratase
MGGVAKLSDADVASRLEGLPGWSRDGDLIRRSFERSTFADAIAFVVRVGFLAEGANHHPDLDVRWRTVHLALTTHDQGGLTDKDFDLAAAIDAVAG